MRATIDEGLCIGCGVCAGECPVVFEMAAGAAEVARVITDPVPADSANCCKSAAKDCPVEAIKLFE